MFKILIFILGCVVAPVIIGKCGAVKKEWIKYRDYTNDNPHQEMTWKLFNSVFYIMDQTHRLYYGKNNTLFYRHDDTTRRLGYKDIYIKFNFFDYFCAKDFGVEYHKENHEKKIKQAFQNIVYSWNQPAGNRSYQSPL